VLYNFRVRQTLAVEPPRGCVICVNLFIHHRDGRHIRYLEAQKDATQRLRRGSEKCRVLWKLWEGIG